MCALREAGSPQHRGRALSKREAPQRRRGQLGPVPWLSASLWSLPGRPLSPGRKESCREAKGREGVVEAGKSEPQIQALRGAFTLLEECFGVEEDAAGGHGSASRSRVTCCAGVGVGWAGPSLRLLGSNEGLLEPGSRRCCRPSASHTAQWQERTRAARVSTSTNHTVVGVPCDRQQGITGVDETAAEGTEGALD